MSVLTTLSLGIIAVLGAVLLHAGFFAAGALNRADERLRLNEVARARYIDSLRAA